MYYISLKEKPENCLKCPMVQKNQEIGCCADYWNRCIIKEMPDYDKAMKILDDCVKDNTRYDELLYRLGIVKENK